MKRAENEARLLEFLAEYITKSGYSPSTREMQAAMGVKSTETIHRLLISLRQDGRITWIDRVPRTVRIVDGNERTAPLDLDGD